MNALDFAVSKYQTGSLQYILKNEECPHDNINSWYQPSKKRFLASWRRSRRPYYFAKDADPGKFVAA